MISVKKTLSSLNLAPLKKLGQNFLVSEKAIAKVISSANLTAQDIIIEVGPGLGALTLLIARQVKQVIAIEKDTGLANALKETLKNQAINNVEVINADVLTYSPPIIDYKLISNLPYNIATAVIMRFLEAPHPPSSMVVMLQKEVGQRIVSIPPRMSKLSVFAQALSDVKLVGYVPKTAFSPQPKVDSAILKVVPKLFPLPSTQTSGGKTSASFYRIFSQLVSAGFAHPRKQLASNLSNSKELNLTKQQATILLTKSGLSPLQRAETLSVDNWLTLTQLLQSQNLDITK